MTPFQLSEFKRLAGERIKGEWFADDSKTKTAVNLNDGKHTHIALVSLSLGTKQCDATAEFISYCGTHADAIVQRIEKLEKALEKIKFMSTSKAPALNSDDASHYKWIAYDCIGIATKALEHELNSKS